MSLLDITKKTAKERGLSLTDVATKAGIAQKSIYQWKTVTPKVDTLKAVADVLGVTTDYLLGTTDEKNPHRADEDGMEEFYRIDLSRVPKSERDTIKKALDKYTRFLLDDMWK
ncbi:helix-turn-helix transcriptional regulator [Weissella koreensis]|uniref:Helix-turn-helix transcriptional regulator n=1 Tax=Weissella koreensis TaxID=165096 RepID=A0A7H1MKG5_9LACO|nr:helix-turn-helix transcriptional regulator [Weissella koreensis]AEJ23099.1 Rep protein [Weissella koreensis KACC 15510]AVH74694.1 XRE family transcriptional regulator [Weissella koreensis]EJF33648.1 hypothetical protein JC2156_04620 [Weissella koreensis KCTC 3621]EJF34050.1 hypothetical protein JC2156_03580 [Weissella koreensis KCTC 3621]MCZ9310541.1 helix-turn-helix transcriptional regulator [Weissella koreensis]